METTLSEEQIKSLEDTISRRMKNTGETRAEAMKHIADYLSRAL